MRSYLIAFCLISTLIPALCQAQVSDDFTDGDFTNGPSWSGDTEFFTVNLENQLQSNGPEGSAVLHLSTPSEVSGPAEWRFYVRFNNAPSNNNRLRFYLMSDNPELEADVRGYYVNIGESGGEDGIDLFRQDSLSVVKIIDGTPGLVADGVNGFVRVLRDDTGRWQLFFEAAVVGATSDLQGEVVDDTYNLSTHLGVWVRHSTTRRQDFFFDDIFAGPIAVDNTPPEVVAFQLIGDNQINLQFSEPLDSVSAVEVSNYELSTGTFPSNVDWDASAPDQVNLTFTNNFPTNVALSLRVQNVADQAGNRSSLQTFPFQIDFLEEARQGEVVINEIFSDPTPAVGLPETEFIELYNTSDQAFQLEGWTYQNDRTSGRLPNYLLEAGAFVILSRSSDTDQFASFGAAIAPSSWPSLTNGGDELGLRNASGLLIDTVNYSIDWYGDENKDGGGYSLERINPFLNNDCPVRANWSASNDASGGTPARQNSIFSLEGDQEVPEVTSVRVRGTNQIEVCFSEAMNGASLENPSSYVISNGLTVASVSITGEEILCAILSLSAPLERGLEYIVSVSGVADCSGNVLNTSPGFRILLSEPASQGDIIINEILADENPSIGLPSAEFIELYNRSDKSLNLDGWRIGTDRGMGSLPSYMLDADSYVIVAKSTEVDSFARFGPAIAPSSWPGLTNSRDEIGLRSVEGTLIDTIQYTIDWYKDQNKQNGGYTLERVNPQDSDCPDIVNWAASEAETGGTPGGLNSVFSTELDAAAPSLVSALLIAPDTIQVCYSESMEVGSILELTNYSLEGASISAAFPLGPAFTCVNLAIDGTLEAGQKYTLTINNVADCSGNITNTALTADIFLGEAAAAFEVIFTELFPDESPSQGLPEAEFLEIFNRTDRILDISGWGINDAGTTRNWGTATIQPGEYLILCDDEDVALFESFGRVVPLQTFISLANSTDTLLLVNELGVTMDYVFYERSWFNDNSRDDGGFTLERRDTDFIDCNNPGNWGASVAEQGGTPGSLNSLNGEFIDDFPPVLLGVRIVDANTLELQFNEQMEASTLLEVGNFMADNGLGNPMLGFPSVPDFTAVKLLFGEEIDPAILYTLSYSGLKDCAGNENDGVLRFGVPEPIREGDIKLNEILFNPVSGGSDFVEIVNISDKVLDLQELLIANVDPDDLSLGPLNNVAEASVLFLPGQIVCLTTDRTTQLEIYLPPDTANIFQVSSLPSFPDSRGGVLIATAAAVPLDTFLYEDDFHFPTLASFDGVSLERISLAVSAADPDNWHSASSRVNYASPGYSNSQRRLTADEPESALSLANQTFSPNGDGVDDVLEINYDLDFIGANARVNIFDANGVLVRTLRQNTLLDPEPGTFFWDGRTDDNNKARVGMYIVLLEVTNQQTGSKEVFKEVAVLAENF